MRRGRTTVYEKGYTREWQTPGEKTSINSLSQASSRDENGFRLLGPDEARESSSIRFQHTEHQEESTSHHRQATPAVRKWVMA